jgi:hypothetical protein
MSNEKEDNRSLAELAKNAIDVQNAVNLSGVVISFARDISRLRVILNESLGKDFSTDKLNQHPICVMYASKIDSLTVGYEGGPDSRFTNAYDWCQEACRD